MKKTKKEIGKNFKAILFDADGTLYDSTLLHFKAYQSVCKELYGFDFTLELYYEQCVKMSKKPPEILEEYGIACNSDEFYSKKRPLYFEVAKQELRPTYGLKKFLKRLQKSKIPCAIVSGASKNSLIDSIELIGIKGFFHFMISHDDVGEKQKPDPYPYLIASNKLGILPKDALAFEDTATGIESAKKAGTFCIAIKNSANNYSDLADADLIIQDYSALKYKISNNQIIICEPSNIKSDVGKKKVTLV